jgi:anion-transporting  ArsA/GET3 family ATPase
MAHSIEDRAHVPLAPAVLVTGKGGVGKTLVAAGLAVAAAKRDGRAVYVEFGDGESGARALGARHPEVKHVVLDPARAVVDAAAGLFGSRRLARLALGNFAMRPLLEAAPAIRELALLELARQVVSKHPGVRVVFDMPATGHSVAWLRVVREVKRVTAKGPLHELCAKLESELLTPSRSSVVVVTLPERLVLAETLSLCDEIESDIGLSVDRLVVNRVPTPLPDDAMWDVHHLASASGPEANAAKQLADYLQGRSSVHREVFRALDSTVRQPNGRGDKGLTLLPLIPREPKAETAADWLVEEQAA